MKPEVLDRYAVDHPRDADRATVPDRKLDELRDIIGHLLVSANPSWEKGIGGQDWKEAMDRARAVLSVSLNK